MKRYPINMDTMHKMRFNRENLSRAEKEAVLALKLFAHNKLALDVLRRVGSLKEKGFSYQGYEKR
ncbi:MAG: hypothetical protein GKR87_04490 [Kiritimatiellae bacterium]|nr:hypothetical protein [Kiritimatiellia bacterium]